MALLAQKQSSSGAEQIPSISDRSRSAYIGLGYSLCVLSNSERHAPGKCLKYGPYNNEEATNPARNWPVPGSTLQAHNSFRVPGSNVSSIRCISSPLKSDSPLQWTSSPQYLLFSSLHLFLYLSFFVLIFGAFNILFDRIVAKKQERQGEREWRAARPAGWNRIFNLTWNTT